MVRIGIVGVGFMGMIHYLAARTAPGGRVTAAVQPRPEEAGRRLARHPRQLRPARRADGPRRRQDATTAFDDLLADPDIDLIDVCIADAPARRHGHRRPEGRQARPGREGDRPDSRRTPTPCWRGRGEVGKLLMVAHVLPFFPEFAFAAEAVRGGRYGKLLGGALQARHLPARLVGRHRRRRQDRRPGRRPAHPRHALHRPDLRRAGAGVLERPGRARTARSTT